MGESLIGVVAEGISGRVYLPPAKLPVVPEPAWKPDQPINQKSPKIVNGSGYGFFVWGDLFTNRQLVALTTFSDLLGEVHVRVLADAKASGIDDDGIPLRDRGAGATAYADAVVTYLAFVLDKCADYWSSFCTWHNSGEKIRGTFPRQAIAMSWDYAETNPFSSSTGNWMAMVNWVTKVVANLPATQHANVCQRDARARVRQSPHAMISTDPPYYDNICYADISDFFYVWLRRNLADVWPDECATLLTPKSEEMIANTYRFASKKKAEKHFESGMAEFMKVVALKTKNQDVNIPATIYYAYKATEKTEEGGVRSTGWDTFLQAVVDAGLHVNATWPLRTELVNRPNAIDTNALASSIVLACRPRPSSAPLATRSEFMAALRSELPKAVKLLKSGNIAPVDFPQSTIGPGISVFSRYAKVVDASGASMPVSDALSSINEVLDEIRYGEEAELDDDTRFALEWYEQHGFDPGPSSDAGLIARAKNISLKGIEDAGVGKTSGDTFCLYGRSELKADWDPYKDTRLTAWEALQYLVDRLEQSESQAVNLLARLGGVGDRAHQLAYILHKIASDNKWTDEAFAYNSLITVWQTLRITTPKGVQGTMGY